MSYASLLQEVDDEFRLKLSFSSVNPREKLNKPEKKNKTIATSVTCVLLSSRCTNRQRFTIFSSPVHNDNQVDYAD